MTVNILAVGDVCGKTGLDFLARRLPAVKKMYDVAFTVVNGENANVVGVSSLQALIQNAVASQPGTMVNALSAALENVGGGGDITIPVYLGGTLLDETIITAQQRMALRSGGR